MISIIIFDMNGVITDDEEIHELATQNIFNKIGFDVTPEIYRKYPILVSEDCIAVQSFKETFSIFFGDAEVLVLKKDLSYVVDSLIYINSPNSLPFNLKTGSRFDCSYAAIDRLSIEYLRKIVLKDSLSGI